MVSWAWNDWEPDTPYEADLRRAERERMSEGWEPLVGWRRPVEPVCDLCWYVLVNGTCAGCVERTALRAAA